MRLVLCVATVAALAASGSSIAQVTPYEAAGRFHIWLLSAEHLASKCAAAYPSIAAQIKQDVSKWQERDRRAIAKAEAVWLDMERQSPRTKVEQQDDRAQLERLWMSVIADGPAVGQGRCTSYFADRAAGGLRTRSPEVFRALEAS